MKDETMLYLIAGATALILLYKPITNITKTTTAISEYPAYAGNQVNKILLPLWQYDTSKSYFANLWQNISGFVGRVF